MTGAVERKQCSGLWSVILLGGEWGRGGEEGKKTPNPTPLVNNFFSAKLCQIFVKLSGQMWPHSPSLQSGTLNVLKAPNWGFFNQSLSDLDQSFSIGPLAITNIIFGVQFKITPSFKSPVRYPEHPPSPHLRLYQVNHVQSWSNLQDTPLSNYQYDFWGSTWPIPSNL